MPLIILFKWKIIKMIVKTDGSFAALITNVLAAVKSGTILYLFPTPVSVLGAAAPSLDIN